MHHLISVLNRYRPGLLGACGLAMLSGCVPSASAEITPFAIDSDYISLVDYAEVSPGDCLARPLEYDGKVPVTDCANSGSAVIVAVTTYGLEAPAPEPPGPDRDVIAHGVCRPVLDAWVSAAPSDFEDRPPPILVMLSSELWRGSSTQLICAYL